jgi:hypothetical protein
MRKPDAMRLEQVLAQWARRGLAASAQEPAVPAFTSGRWTNEYGSVADIEVDGDRLSGTYTSAVGSAAGPLTGPLTGYARGDTVAFTVLWPAHMRSITSWVGQVVDTGPGPELKALWQLIVDIPDADEATGLWTTIHSGADTFR